MKNKNRVIHKIEIAYADFKKEMQALSSKDVYDYAYKIFSVEEIYLILINDYSFTDIMIKNILKFKGNILEQIYQEWISSSYNHTDVFSDIIKETVYSLS